MMLTIRQQMVQTKDDLHVQIAIDSGRISNLTTKTDFEMQQMKALIQEIKTDIGGKLNTLFNDFESKIA